MAYPFDVGDKYQICTIQSGKMPSAESGITLFIDLSIADKAGSDLWDTVTSSGGDIRVTSGDGATQYPRCIIHFNRTAKSGMIAVKISGSIDVGTQVRIYYNGSATEPAANSTYGSQAAWDSSYLGAYYASNYSGTTISDATSNARNLTFNGFDQYKWVYKSVSNAGPTSHQGSFYDGTYWYFFDTNYLYKRSTVDGSNVATNSNPIGNINTDKGSSCTHLGSGVKYGNYIYIVAELWTGTCGEESNQFIARFLASDLSYVDAFDISAQDHECSGLCIDPSAGTNGIIYVSSYCQANIYKYDLATPSTYFGAISLSDSATLHQGIALNDAKTEFMLANASNIKFYSITGTYIGRRVIGDATSGSKGDQSAFFYDGDIYWHNGTDYKIYKFEALSKPDQWSSVGPCIFVGNSVDNYAQASLTPGDVGSFQYLVKPRRYYDYNAIFDTNDSADTWEGWFYSDGRIANRIGTTRAYDLDNLHASNGAAYQYLAGFGWTHTTTVDTGIFVDGSVRANGTETWNAPGTLFNWNGEGGGNNAGESYFYFMAFRNIDLCKDADRLTSEYNNISAPSTFWAFGNEEAISASLLPINDNAQGDDSVSVSVSLAMSDSGSGADDFSGMVASVPVSDVGQGTDLISPVISLSVSDTASAVDAVSQILNSLLAQDTGSAVDAIAQVIASLPITDTGSAADAISLLTEILKTITDTGAGSESISVPTVSLSMSDSGVASDLINAIAAVVSIADSGSAADLINTIQTQLIQISESALGSESVSVAVSLTVSDVAAAMDAIGQILNSLAVNDSFSGLDSILKTDLNLLPHGQVKITFSLKVPGVQFSMRAPGVDFTIN